MRKKIKEAEKRLEEIEQKYAKIKLMTDEQEKRYNDIKTKYEASCGSMVGYIELVEDLGYTFETPFYSVEQTEKSILQLEKSLAEMVSKDEHFIINRPYLVDGSKSKGERMQKEYIKNLFNGFNAYYQLKRKSVTISNLIKSKELIRNNFETKNKKAAIFGISLNEAYLNCILGILENTAYLKKKKQEKKERLQIERQRLREQEKLLEEAENEKKKLLKERKEYETALNKTIDNKEQEEIRNKIAEIDNREATIDYRITQQKAGWLYIISTPAMPDIVKIGVSRRLNPMTRIKELSSASVPYPFMCHGLVFSEDVFSLETKIHRRFDNKRVNRKNLHKEFFKVSPKEAIEILQEEYRYEVHFVNEEEGDD